MLAWKLRGTARARDTTKEQFEHFHRVLARAKSPSLAVLMLHAARESDGKPSTFDAALDVHLRWLASDGASGVHLLDDLGWAAHALVYYGRPAEAVPYFRRLGDYAVGGPWRHSSRAAYFFNEARIKACKAAGKLAHGRGTLERRTAGQPFDFWGCQGRCGHGDHTGPGDTYSAAVAEKLNL